MSHYKRNAATNRDALFGNSSVASTSSTKATTTNTSSSSSTTTINNTRSQPSSTPFSKASISPLLTGSERMEKIKEAEEFRTKAKKAMSKSLFSSPNPMEAQLYYGKAADAYKRCGEIRLEKLCRAAYAECLELENSLASAAAQYVLSAELTIQEATSSSIEMSKTYEECHLYYSKAAEAYRNANQLGRAGEAMMKGALSLLGDDKGLADDDFVGGKRFSVMERQVLSLIEEAVELHVPDPLNRYKNFRQTGKSVFVGIKSKASKNAEVEFDEVTLLVCRNNVITSSFAHETLFKCIHKLIEWNELQSAIYAAGAASYILETDGISSITLARAYCIETVLSLALGDVVAADQQFMHHIQNTAYLSTRECELSEDLIRAIKVMDYDLLEEARNPSGKNRAALSSLHRTLQELVSGLRVSGVAKTSKMNGLKGISDSVPSIQTPVLDYDDEALQASLDANYAEMDELMNDMGLNSEEEDHRKNDEEAEGNHRKKYEEEEEDEDDIDLR